ncbi:ATP-binding protein [Streptomyces bambusae]|uniref:ATP-binding protein n=1 Tax=Streptomyces bambusae TaxID=1550616 RepID=UPI001CFD37FC|nr:ATP-binding protein [Streptomyces bambusae]MCB5166935.1 ATP-binding protein [Streptomyces bambusae]
MSLPLTRRIARTALLLAAGAAPVVGAAGSASAADLAPVPQLDSVTALDTASLGQAVDGAARQTTSTTGAMGGGAVAKELPAGLAGGEVAKTLPAADTLPVADTLLVASTLPAELPTGQLPLKTPLG